MNKLLFRGIAGGARVSGSGSAPSLQLAEGCSGLDVARELNARGVPCVFTTGNCPGRDIDDALGCLHKPFNHIQLLGAVKAANAILAGETAEIPREMHLFGR